MYKNLADNKIMTGMTEGLFCLTLSGDALAKQVDIVNQYHELGEEQLWKFATREGSESIVASTLINALGESTLPQRWMAAAEKTEQKIALYLEQLDRVAGALAESGIPLVALKNSGIARGIYRDLAASPMGDIDVLVRPEDFRKAHEIILRLGYEMGDRSPFEMEDIDAAERHGGAEYTYTLADGSTLWFELQWRPVAGRWIQPDQEPPAGELMERSISIEGSAARLLSPEDNLLQVCLHTAKHSYVRAPGFRLHTDVDRIVRAYAINWDTFCIRVEKMRVKTAVYLSLMIPSVFLNTPIPESVLKRLNHSPIKHRLLQRWLMKVGLFDPEARKWSKIGYIFFNLMLYDTLGGVLRAVIPDSAWMIKRYDIKLKWTLPFWYLVRAAELVFKRANT